MSRRLEHFVTLAAAGTLVASLLPLAARFGWMFDLAAHFRVQYLIADLVLALVLLVRRQRAFGFALLAAAAVNAIPVLPYVPWPPPAANALAAGTAPIKLFEANVLFRNHSAKRLLEIVREESPDVVVLVEYTPEWAAQAAELRAAYPHHLEGPRSNAYGLAIFSRFPFDSAVPFALGNTDAIEARLRTPSGPLTVIGVHLRSPTTPWRSMMRNRQLDSLAERVKRVAGPVAVLGDFNITPYSPYYADWLERAGLTDSRRGRTLAPSWPTLLPIAAIPIDHCAVSRDVTVLAHRGLRAFGSDHYPILAEVALPPPLASQN